MQDAEPSWALKRSPAPQLFSRMNKHVELLAAKAAVLSLPSAVVPLSLLDELRAPDGKIAAQVRRPPHSHLLLPPPNLFPAFFFIIIYLFSH